MIVLALGLLADAAEPYPVTDADLLALRRVETEALHLALKKDGRTRARYARTAVIAHGRRMERLGPELAALERAVERVGAGSGVPLLKTYPAEQARERALAAGAAMAILLDDLDPDWRSDPDHPPLDALLDAATAGVPPLLLSDDPRAAEEETRALRQAQIVEGTGYLTQPGYGLVVRAPLAVVDEDPFAAVSLEDHARYYRGDVRFAGASGTLSVRGHGAFVDTGEVRVAGLDADTMNLAHEGDEVVVTGSGVELRVRGAVYSGTRNGLTVNVVPGTSMDPDPAVFALSLLARTAGRRGAPSTRVRHLREQIGGACAAEVRRFEALARRDDPPLGASYAAALRLGGPPDFLPADDGAAGANGDLPSLLGDFWRCAGLSAVWEGGERAEWIAVGQQALQHAGPALGLARAVDPERWPWIVVVPDAYRAENDAFASSGPDGVAVVVGPPRVKDGPDPVALAREVMHHVVDPKVLGRPCPALAALHVAARKGYPAIGEDTAEADRWLAASLVRALVVDVGILQGEAAEHAVRGWVAEGYLVVPTILEGLSRSGWEVWLDAQCGSAESEPAAFESSL